MTLAVIMIQGHGRRLFASRKMLRPIGGVDKQQILETIVVEIEKSHASAHGFRQQLVSVRAVIVHEGDSSLPGDIGELGGGDFAARGSGH